MVAKAKTNLILKAVQETKVGEFSDMREYLNNIYLYCKNNSEKYSWFQFSADLGLKSNNLVHLFITGRRRISKKSAIKMAEGLGLPPVSKAYFIASIVATDAKNSETREEARKDALKARTRLLRKSVDKSIMKLFKEWYVPVVHEMVSINDFKADPDWIAGQIRPRITPKKAQDAIDTLIEIGLLKWNRSKTKLEQVEKQIKSTKIVKDLQSVAYYNETIPLGLDSIHHFSPDKRLLNSYVLKLSEAKFQKIKEILENLENEIFKIEDSSEGEKEILKERVMHLSMQFYPVTLEIENRANNGKETEKKEQDEN